MELMFQIIGIALCSTMLCLVLRKNNPEYATAVAILTTVLILGMVVSTIHEVILHVRNLAIAGGVNLSYLETVFKVISIAYLCEYCCAVLEDAGETAIAKKVELAGKVIIFCISLPVIESLFRLITALF